MTLKVTITNDDDPEVEDRVIELFEAYGSEQPRSMTIVPGGKLTTYLHEGNQILLTEKKMTVITATKETEPPDSSPQDK